MTRPYTLTFYIRVVQLYRRMPAKAVAKIMSCAPSTVRVAKFRILHLKRIETRQTEKSGVSLAP